jgi:hypothetical protein
MTSPMSITQLVNNQVDIEDPDVKIAAEALGELSNKPVITLPPLSTPSTTPSSPLPTPTSSSFNHQRLSFSSESTIEEDNKLQFIHRVSNLPILNSALKVYENSKNSNSVVKYGAEMVESIAAPIYGKFDSLSGVDEWGCKQLDKLGYSTTKEVKQEVEEVGSDDDDASYALSRILLDDGLRKRSRNTSPHRPHSITKPVATRQYHRQQPLVRSKWHQIVMHASSAAGTTAAVISEESMKCLRYCLSWLQVM